MYISSQGSYMSRSPTVLPQGLSGLLKSLLLLEQPNRSEYFSNLYPQQKKDQLNLIQLL
jgi:hypothetical protein